MTVQIGRYTITPTIDGYDVAYWIIAENGEGFLLSEENLEKYFDKLFKEWM